MITPQPPTAGRPRPKGRPPVAKPPRRTRPPGRAAGARPPRPSSPAPALRTYDVILINISGGKGSQASLDLVVALAAAAGVRGRIVTVFCDLGPDDGWPGTRELAAEHAGFYHLRHEVIFREVVTPGGQRVRQTLSEHIEQRGRWPDTARRYCTSDMKRAVVYRLMTRLAGELRAAGVTGRPVRILNVMGHRAQESPAARCWSRFAATSGPPT